MMTDDDMKQNVNTSSAAAGADSTEDPKKRTAEPQEPLFLKDSPEGDKGNPQDEKDETEE